MTLDRDEYDLHYHFGWHLNLLGITELVILNAATDT